MLLLLLVQLKQCTDEGTVSPVPNILTKPTMLRIETQQPYKA